MQDIYALHMSARTRRLSEEKTCGRVDEKSKKRKKKKHEKKTNEGRRGSVSSNDMELHTLVKGRSSSVMRNKREDVWCILGECESEFSPFGGWLGEC